MFIAKTKVSLQIPNVIAISRNLKRFLCKIPKALDSSALSKLDEILRTANQDYDIDSLHSVV